MKIVVNLQFSWVFFFLGLHTLQPTQALQAQPHNTWTIFGYAQAKNDLGPFLPKNLQEIASALTHNSHVTVIFELHESGKQGTYRYKIRKDAIELVYHNPHETHHDIVKSFTEGAIWAFKNHPSTYTGLIFWGHASGIVDPKDWSNHYARHYRAVDEITEDDLAYYNRGILFDWELKKYMTNQEMVDALNLIRQNALDGRQISLIGMDTCFMSQYEVAYQIRHHARYLVSSQEVEHAMGWAYKNIFAGLTISPLPPEELVKLIVSSFEDFYKSKISWYTQSALDLSKLDPLKNNLDTVSSLIIACQKKYGTAMRELVLNSRKTCLQFNSPGYVDLHSFYTDLYNNISKFIAHGGKVVRSESISSLESEPYHVVDPFYDDPSMVLVRKMKHPKHTTYPRKSKHPVIPSPSQITYQELESLKNHLKDGMNLIDTIVLANATGPGMKRARGISIYFPTYIDPSYLSTEFGKQSLWTAFLKAML